ncbi:hypothetical protein GGX14DRAFT_372828 [Mycena pura]|uniref:DUF6570 domain-containing protein n=1 Tax=Mycena pura TaxID=153505 RepID=A0AAD6V583_9AGAR|nr:hypothetical protein GGX14DRAFT_372828 [Mycena pura]
MIARCRAKCWIIQLKEEVSNLSLPNTQRGMKGHIVIYPQQPSRIAQLLPPSLDEITDPICVLFVGAKPPTPEWLKEHAKPLTVRPQKVRAALKWLQKHNRLYKDIVVNEDMLQAMPDKYVLPVQIEHILPSESDDSRTSRYDVPSFALYPTLDEAGPPKEVRWENVVITDVEASASSNQLRDAALKHVKAGGGYVTIPHDPNPVNEFMNPDLFPLIYPTLFPYGMGGFQDKHRESSLSTARHIKQLFQLSDRRFQEHYSFLFTAFNIVTESCCG